MLANADLTPDFNQLNGQFKTLVAELLKLVHMQPQRVEVDATSAGHFRGYDSGKLYVVQSGALTARYHGRALFILDEGDLLVPDSLTNAPPEMAVMYGSEAGASLDVCSAIEFMQKVYERRAALKVWNQILLTHASIMMRLAPLGGDDGVVTTPGFELYEPGEVIIREGDIADEVFNLTSGAADVFVGDVPVGRIAEGEIFGAMAALTHGVRSATVKARTACSVVKVPKAQFTDLIKTNPATIHGLLVDMANSIVNLNEQLVGLRGSNDRN